ncbi:hypothetical protein, partial [Inconstantimicrobium porci]|uniref:hypothetical protein n=1 Tax=Inconstantimicrobium porci TaxID=2652291 RepID=UPI0024099AEC
SAVIALVLVFYKPILSHYYTSKADSSKNDTSKLLYASKSLALKSNKICLHSSTLHYTCNSCVTNLSFSV